MVNRLVADMVIALGVLLGALHLWPPHRCSGSPSPKPTAFASDSPSSPAATCHQSPDRGGLSAQSHVVNGEKLYADILKGALDGIGGGRI